MAAIEPNGLIHEKFRKLDEVLAAMSRRFEKPVPGDEQMPGERNDFDDGHLHPENGDDDSEGQGSCELAAKTRRTIAAVQQYGGALRFAEKCGRGSIDKCMLSI